MLVVKFNEISGFLDELKMDKDSVDRKIVRLVFRTSRSGDGPTIVMTLLVTTIINNTVIRLEHRVGSYFPDSAESNRVIAEANAKADNIQAVVKELGLEIRTGTFEVS